MSIVAIKPGGQIELDPSAVRTIAFDWDRKSLRASTTISTSTFTITVIKQNGATILTKDNQAILTAIDASIVLERTVGASRATQVRLIGTTATEGDLYEVANTIVTSETPAQTKEQSVRILIQNQ
jgi:hypothetical protein